MAGPTENRSCTGFLETPMTTTILDPATTLGYSRRHSCTNGRSSATRR